MNSNTSIDSSVGCRLPVPGIACGLVYCPRPGISWERSMEWIRAGGFCGELLVSQEYERGIIGNYLHVCRMLLGQTEAEWLVVFENDVQPCRGCCEVLRAFVSTLVPVEVGCISLFTPEVYASRLAGPGWSAVEMGWLNVAGQAICFQRERLRQILDEFHWEPLVLNSLRQNGSGGGVDSVVGDLMLRRRLPVYYHDPSLVEHQGIITSRAKRDPRAVCHRGLNFRLAGPSPQLLKES